MRKLNFMRLWFSLFAGIGFGFVVEFFVGIWRKQEIDGILMAVIITVGTIVAWRILKHNNDFKK